MDRAGSRAGIPLVSAIPIASRSAILSANFMTDSAKEMNPLETLLSGLGISTTALAERGLRRYAPADQLICAEIGEDRREHRLTPEAAAAWQRMKAAALADGIELALVSAYRSIERQAEIVRGKLDAGQSLEEILLVSAPPGYSEHHTGRAIDIGTPGCASLETAFETTPAFAWLTRRAGEFGFSLSYPEDNAAGYQYEPWHWCHGWSD